MGDHERIWLQNADDAKHQGEGRMWCQDKIWPDDAEDGEPTEYVRADLFATLQAEVDRLANLNAHLMGDDESKPRYTTKRLRYEVEQRTAVLQAENARMREALTPFADRVERADQNAVRMGYAPSFDDYRTSWTFSFGELRAARTALGGIND